MSVPFPPMQRPLVAILRGVKPEEAEASEDEEGEAFEDEDAEPAAEDEEEI